MGPTANQNARRSAVRLAALFVLVAVPGVFLFLFSLGRLFLAAVEPEYRTTLNLLGLGVGLGAGSLAMLAGTQRWGKWLYLVVLVPLPFLWFGLLATMAYFDVWRVVSPILPATILALTLGVWGARRIDRHYRREAANREHVQPGV